MKTFLTMTSAAIAIAALAANVYAATPVQTGSNNGQAVTQAASVAVPSVQTASPNYLMFPDWPDEGGDE